MPGARTQVQDRLAMIDEGGILLIGESNEADARAETPRPDSQVLFGHALYEHMLLRRALPIRGFPLRVQAPRFTEAPGATWFSQVDAQLVTLLPGLLSMEIAPTAVAWQQTPTLSGLR
jgi:hypothetical protein